MGLTSNWDGKLIAANASRHAAQLWLLQRGNEDRTLFPLAQASHWEKHRKIGEMATNPRIHEIIEDEASYSTAVRTGK